MRRVMKQQMMKKQMMTLHNKHILDVHCIYIYCIIRYKINFSLYLSCLDMSRVPQYIYITNLQS